MFANDWRNSNVYFQQGPYEFVLQKQCTYQSWSMKKYHKTFEFLNNNLNFNISISSDSTLNYRGAQLNKLSLLFKPSEDCFKGDLDLDGSVDISDIILMVNIIFELINTEGFLFCVSDMNSNQIININDIVLVVEKILYN